MNHNKATHLERIRSESAYPAFRMLTDIAYWFLIGVGIIGLVVGFLAAFFASFGIGGVSFGLVWALLLYFIAHVVKETSLMLADVADSITDANSRHEESDY